MRRKLFIFLAIFFIGLIYPSRSLAQEEPDNRLGAEAAQLQIDEYLAAVEDCSTPSLECLVKNTYTFLQIEMAVNIVGNNCAISDTGECLDPTTTPDEDEDEQGVSLNKSSVASRPKRGAINDMYSFIGTMYSQPPANTGAYIADVLNSANIATPAYAQGLGFAALDPVLELWKKFRNIAYMCFIFIFITIGFLIMFRAKIGGQTAVTAQQAIPSVIVSLIFVTFSYAIAGLLIDLMYVVMFMMVGLFSGGANANVINYSIFQLAKDLFMGSGSLMDDNIGLIRALLESIGDPLGGATSGLGALIGGLTMTIVIAIALLISTFKLFFELLKSYAGIILSVVTAPLILMVGAIPGKNVFKTWFMGLVGNLAAFPTVLLMVIMYKEFAAGGSVNTSNVGGFMPPFLVSMGVGNMIGYLMGLAVALALPEIVAKVKKILGAGDVSDIAKAAMDRGKAVYDGKGMPYGIGANIIPKTAAGVAMGGTGGLIGGGIGGVISKARGGSFRDGAVKGGIIGGGAGILAPKLPAFGGKLIKTAANQTSQALVNYAIGDHLEKLESKDSEQKIKDIETGMQGYIPPATPEGGSTVAQKDNVTKIKKPNLKKKF